MPRTQRRRASGRALITDQHPRSRRVALLEDHGSTLWLYLLEQDGQTVACDVQVFNRQAVIEPVEPIEPARTLPGPADAQAAPAGHGLPVGGMWAFTWSEDGEAVAVLHEGQPVAFARATRRVGFSRQVIEPGPWGVPWCQKTFNEVFGIHADD